jgi:hypothetical protein
MTTNFSKHIELPPDYEEIEVEFEVQFSNSSIGFYEFWGQKCFDQGHLEIDNITFDEAGLSAEQIDYINDRIKKGDLDSDAFDSLETLEDSRY